MSLHWGLWARALLASLILFTVSTFAQIGVSGVSGVVTDSTGAVIGGATVTVTNIGTGNVKEISSDESGQFIVKDLLPARYFVKISADGFNSLMVNDLELRVGEISTLIIKLKPASEKEVIEVRASDVQRVSPTTQVQSFINEDLLATLPLNGRNFIDLALLLPGNRTQALFDPTKQNTTEIASVGQSGRDGNITVDGADNNENFVGGILQNFPQDAIREFQIVTTQASAEVGRTGSSFVNIVTKSGTNEFHGSGSFFFRNDNLSALPATLDRSIVSALGRPPFDREQYAATLGGPIKRDRAWFFNAFEVRDQDAIMLVGQRDQVLRQVRNAFLPVPLRDYLYLGRVDWQVTNKDRMAFRYSLQRDNLVGVTGSIAANRSPSSSYVQKFVDHYDAFVYNYTHAFSTNLLNDFTFQQNHFDNNGPASIAQPNFVFPSILEGGGVFLPQTTFQNTTQLRNNVSTIIGNHDLKFGGEFQRIGIGGDLEFLKFGAVFLAEDFASLDRNRDGAINDLDIPVRFSFRGITNNKTVNYDDKYFGFYIQDNWKIRPNFVLNLGVRYEIDTQTTDKDFFKNINPAARAFLSPKGRDLDKNNIGPRIGFSWDPFKDGRTSIHGSYGIYYSRVLFQILDNERRFDGKNLVVDNRDGSELDDDGRFVKGTPTINNPFTGPSFPGDFGIFILDNDFGNPMVQQFNFGIRREIVRDLIVSIDGTHTFGTDIPIARDLGVIVNPIVNSETSLTNIEPSGKNWYDAMFINVEKRANKTFGFIASYTFSKALNYNNDELAPGSFFPENSDNLRAEKGHSGNDLRHVFSFAGNVNLPLGFNLSPIFTTTSKQPFDIIIPDGSARLPYAQRNAATRQFKTGRQLNDYIRQVNAGGGVDGVPLPFVNDNLKLGDNFYTFDMRVTKTFKLSERVNILGIVEAFNLFNVTNIRGVAVFTSGFQNVLRRDSQDPNSPGFLTSSSFGSKRGVAGGVFGSGGPRAFQLAVKVNF